jgi:CheY-like chemotaxis protein
MLRNLVANALKFSRTGGIVLAAHRREGRVAFEVWDTGAGIAADQQERIFGEFERASDDVHGPNEGLGLGLSIVKRYAGLLGIDIKLASRLGHGTALTLLMPTAGAEPKTAAATSPPAAHEATLQPGLSVLLIDDDQQILSAMGRELSDRGCVPRAFASGAEAETALSAGLRPDVAIVDFNLGGGNTGIDVLQRLEGLNGPIPSLILTGGTDSETLSAVMATGRPWLIKPADPDAVARQLKELVEASRRS